MKSPRWQKNKQANDPQTPESPELPANIDILQKNAARFMGIVFASDAAQENVWKG